MWFFLIDSCIWNRINAELFMQFAPLVLFEVAHFKEPISSSILSPHSHVILHAGLARSCRIHIFKKQRKTFSLGRRCPSERMRRVKSIFVCLSPTVWDGPPSPGGRGLFFGWWILRLRFSAQRRMTGGEAYCEEWKFSDLTNQQKGSLVLCA